MNQKEYKRLKEWAKKLLGENYDKFDLEAYKDSSLSLDENKTNLRDLMKPFIRAEIKEREELKRARAEEDARQIKEAIEQEKKVEEWNNRELPAVKVSGIFKHAQELIRRLVSGDTQRLIIVRGSKGTGKSIAIKQTLTELGAKHSIVTGYVSPAFLYRILYDHRHENDIIWFREAAGLFDGERSLNMIKSAFEDEKSCVITKQTYSKADDDLPNNFLYSGKAIIDVNKIHSPPRYREHLDAVLSRAEEAVITLSPKEVKDLLMEIAGDDEFKKDVTKFLAEHYEGWGVTLDLRTQRKAIEFAEYYKNRDLDWREELKEELDQRKGNEYRIIYELAGMKAVKLTTLIGELILARVCNNASSARQFIQNAMLTKQLFKASHDERNYLVCLDKGLAINGGD